MTPAEIEAAKRIAGAVPLMMPAVDADGDFRMRSTTTSNYS